MFPAKQFVLSSDPRLLPQDWPLQSLQGWSLAADPTLPIASLVTDTGANCGWILGYPITTTSFPKSITIPTAATTDPTILMETLQNIGGRYLVVMFGETYAHVIPDATASLSAVFSTHSPIIAATPTLLNPQTHPWDDELISVLRMPESALWYPFGTTPRRHVQRLLPNHALDLKTWTIHRTWTPPEHWQRAEKPELLTQEIFNTVQTTLQTLAQTDLLHLSLTAGRDSRMLLACARPIIDRCAFFTFAPALPNADTHIAQLLAQRGGLNHRLLSITPATPEEQARWMDLVGACVSGEIWRIHPTLKQLDNDRVLLPGMAGEVGRAFYWQAQDRPTTRFDAPTLLQRMGVPNHPRLVDAATKWITSINTTDPWLLLDLAYLEQRLGGWGGPQQYGGDPWSKAQLFPLGHPRIIMAMLKLPVAYRFKQRLASDLCRLGWAELLDLPFNEYTGFWRYPRKIARTGKLWLKRLIRR